MANNFLLFGMLVAVGWVFVSDPPPMKSAGPLAISPVAAVPSGIPYVRAGHSSGLETRRDPVPLVRSVRESPASQVASRTNEAAATIEQDDLDRRAAKVAAEMDGYRRVSIIGKAGSGAWRVKAYRGTTEVLLTIDGTGRVSMD
jgi:hypothetical protein